MYGRRDFDGFQFLRGIPIHSSSRLFGGITQTGISIAPSAIFSWVLPSVSGLSRRTIYLKNVWAFYVGIEIIDVTSAIHPNGSWYPLGRKEIPRGTECQRSGGSGGTATIIVSLYLDAYCLFDIRWPPQRRQLKCWLLHT